MIALHIALALNAPVIPVANSIASTLPIEQSNSNYTISNLAAPTLEKTLAGLDTELNDARADQQREGFNYATAPSPESVGKFTNASQKYQVPVDTLMAIAQKDRVSIRSSNQQGRVRKHAALSTCPRRKCPHSAAIRITLTRQSTTPRASSEASSIAACR